VVEQGRRNAVAASNEGLAGARGEFVVLLDPGDLLDPNALATIDAALRASPDADLAYSDEDRIDAAGGYSDPVFKPGWSPERLRTQMYVGKVCALRRTAIAAAGGLDPELEEAHEWDLVLKVSERGGAVVRVPGILCHRPIRPVAPGEAVARAVRAHCARVGLEADAEHDTQRPGLLHLKPALRRLPPVSIVIPTAGQSRRVRGKRTVLVTHCVRSILSTSTYDAYEIVCVVDPSTEAAILDELRALAGGRLRLVSYEGTFNFSAKVNCGARVSGGENLLVLNDDMEVLTPDWIERMVMYCGLEGVGAVGGRLLWEDGRLQHAGLIFEDGLPGHVYRGAPPGFDGYQESVVAAQDYLAVTAACLMTPRTAFERVGGFEEELPVNYNDVDYCLKLREVGMRVVYDPDTILYHFESSSRSAGVAKWETKWLLDRWRGLTEPDPFSNPSLRYGHPRSRSPKAWLSSRLRRWLR
jgi:GT2 family glycosyltransferase